MRKKCLVISWAFRAEDLGENPLENTVFFCRTDQRHNSMGLRLCIIA
jgi:hypothetical protein